MHQNWLFRIFLILASPSFCLHNIYIKETRAIQKLHEKRNVRKLVRVYSLDISEQKGKTILGEQTSPDI